MKSLIKNSRSKISFENQFKVFLGKLPNIINCNPDFPEYIMNYNIPDEKLYNSIYDELNDSYLKQCRDVASNIESSLKVPHNKEIFIKNFISYSIVELFAKNFTGIVLAGFNEDSLFPSCCSFKICYLYDEKYVLCDFQHYDISPQEGNVRINMFAQHDVINTFLKSINSSTKLKILGFFNKEHKEYLEKILDLIKGNNDIDDNVKQNIISEIKTYDAAKNLFGGLVDTINKIEKEEFEPMLLSIGALPYVELSNLCESLIKITSLKRKVDSNLETVGGDIDVAIITKGDVFIWTKRKHYFDADLNPQFFERRR